MKHGVLFTAHLDSETGAIIITPGDREVRIQDEKPAAPDYSNCIGKFCKYIGADVNMNGKYRKIVDAFFQPYKKEAVLETPEGIAVVLEDDPNEIYYFGTFDLDNPRDTNPDEERIVQFDAERMGDAVRFQTWDGRDVKGVVVNDVDVRYPVTGYIDGDNLPEAWTLDGFYHKCSSENSLDLFMVIKGGGE